MLLNNIIKISFAGLFCVSAQANTDFFLQGSIGGAALDKDTVFNGRANLGVSFRDNTWLFGAGIDYLDDNTVRERKTNAEAWAMNIAPINDKFGLYGEFGVNLDEGAPLLGIGINYHLSQKLDGFLGYRWYHDSSSDNINDIYTVNMGVRYTFGSNTLPLINNTPNIQLNPENQTDMSSVQSEALAPQSVIASISNSSRQPPTLNEGYNTKDNVHCVYIVIKDDWPIKLAKKFNIEFNELLNMNQNIRSRLQNGIIYPDDIIIIPIINCQ